MDPISIAQEAKEFAEIKDIKHSLQYPSNGSMISNNITNDLYHTGHNIWRGFLFVRYKRQFCRVWSVGSTKLALCPESRRSACGKLSLCT